MRLSRAAGLWTSEWFDVPPQIDQFGDLISADFWTGANRFDALPQAADNCNDWTSNSDTLGGFMHLTTNSDLREPWKTDPGDTVVPLLCLED